MPAVWILTFCTAVEHNPEALFSIVCSSREGDVYFVGRCANGKHLFRGATYRFQNLACASAESRSVNVSE